ncbi:heparinase II/III family protein [Ruegeria pomeroyi]|nr:heparinase II/III family protein [Ruegeria pomeroyi]
MLLRRPEAENFYNGGAAREYDKSGLINVRSPHPKADLTAPIDWRMNPPKDKTWGLYFHTLGWLQVFIFAIDKPGDWQGRLASPKEDLKSIVMSCIQDVLPQEPNFKAPQWDDHALAYRCSNLSFFYAHVLKDVLSAEERELYLEAIRKHARILSEFIESGKWANSNHLIFHVEGLADAWAVFRNDLPELDGFMDQATEAIIGFINKSISEEGTSSEHASFYQAFLMGRISKTMEFFSQIGHELPINIDPRLKKGAAFLWSIMPRWGVVPPFGDTQFEKKLDMRHVKRFMVEPWVGPEYLQWHDPEYADYQPPALQSYRQNGFHIFRNHHVAAPDALYSLFLERPFRGPHGHWDGNSFMTYFGGVPFLIDSGGPFKYGTPLRYNYFMTQLAHNSVVFGDKGNQITTHVTSSSDDQALSYAIGRAEFTDGAVWVRIFGHLDGDSVFAVDLVQSAEGYDGPPPAALFHISPKLAVQKQGSGLELRGETATARMSFAARDGDSTRASSGEYSSKVTAVDTRFEEAPLVTREVTVGEPLLTMLSFADKVAHEVSISDQACRIVLKDGAGSLREVSIPLDDQALAGMDVSRAGPCTEQAVPDLVRVINLDEDRPRLEPLQEKASDLGYGLQRVGGVRGLYLPELLLRTIPGAAKMERGTLGCFLSHLRAWEEIANGPDACGFIVEDDVKFADWMPRGLSAKVAASPYDLVICNRRIQEDELQPIEDRSGDSVELLPLFDLLMEKPPEFRAPGGEGYFLTQRGARTLLETVARHGIHGDVDWFMIMQTLNPDQRSQFKDGTALKRQARKISQLYPESPLLKGAVLSPWMVVHLAPPSRRKRDNKAHADKMA